LDQVQDKEKPMPIQDDLPSLYAYTRWADGRMFEAVRKLSPEQYVQEPAPGWDPIRSSLIHIGWAMDIWSRRLNGEASTTRVTEADYPTLDDVERYFRQGHDAFDRHIAALTPDRLASLWSYHDLKGVRHSSPLWTVYRHVANHATYHRGQVASKLKRFGVEPPFTDLSIWAREQVAQV
jgi:uncharacterized damage-inducible protein DinB